MQHKRACRKPGAAIAYHDDVAIYRTSSPTLFGGPHGALRECPVGYLQREAPWVWDALAAAAYAENAGLEVLRQSAFLQQALRIIGSEKTRHRESAARVDRGKSDARHAKRMLKGR